MAHAAHSIPQSDARPHGGISGPACAAGFIENSAYVGREARIARAIAEAARTEAACMGGARLLRIGVNIGADCEIDLALLDDAFKVISKGSEIESVAMHLASCPRRNLCHGCGCEFSSRVAVTKCPKCTSTDLELVGGDELELSFIEVERA